MKRNLLILVSVSLAAFFFSSCTSPTQPKGGGGNPQTSTIRGVVLRSDDQSKVPNVVVYDTRGTAPADTSKADGSFQLTYQLTSQYSGSLVASRVTFGSDTLAFTLAQGANDSLPRALVLKADTSSQKTSGSSGIIASIVLVGGGDVNSISIRGTGFTESALLTFEARDSLGVTVGAITKSTLYFSLLGGPGGGEYIFPVSGVTDLTGRVSTRVTSGTKAGVVQVFAYAKPDTSNPNYIVKSSPVRLTISGGLPDPAHFSMSAQTFNIAGMLFDNLRDNFNVIIGDNQGNPVRAGTAVYFSTTAGIIQPSAITDANGAASVSLITGNPRPIASLGRVTVTATTIGDSGTIVRQSSQIVFSGATIITPPAGNFTNQDSSSYSFNYSVADPFGNPIVSKSTIAVTVAGPGSGDLELTGDVNVTMPDASLPGPGTTQFSAKLRDKTRGGANGLIYVTIKVTTDPATGNGNASATFAGYQVGTGGGGGFGGGFGVRQPSSITLSSIAPANGNLSVQGTGSSETARLTFVVRDSSGNPISDPLGLSPKVYVTFSNSPNLGGGEFIFPVADSTDALGQVSTTFSAGSKSGVIQVTAQTLAGARIIQAAPVAITISGGLPDSNHFTPTLSKVNMPGLVKTGALGTVNVLVGDFAGNPAAPGTKLYFSTTGGVISASAVTDNNGQASASIQGGSPAPNDLGPGRGLISIKTVGFGGNLITKQLPFLFSGSPVISGPSSGFQISDSGQYFFTYKVSDLNGNPLSGGTSIAVTASGAGSGNLSLKGDATRTLPDTKDTSFTNFAVQVQDNSGPPGTVTFTITVTSENGAGTYSWNGTKLAKGVVAGGGGAGYPSSIQVLAVNPAPPGPISVKGTGSTETATMSFQVKDSLGNPLDPTRATNVLFSIVNGPGGGEFLFPASAVTNTNGQVTTTLNAGTKSGVVQVVAQTTVGAITITSSPVQMTIASGLADPAHFTLHSSALNVPFTSSNSLQPVGTFSALIGDRYGNPAQGTAVYFTSNGGVITSSTYTGLDGLTIGAITLKSGNPFPAGGIDTVTAITQGENGVNITTKKILTVSGDAIVSAPAALPTVTDGGFVYLNFDVKDVNNNPIAAANSITVTVTGDAASQLALTGNTSITTVDTRDTSTVHYQVKITDGTPNGGTGGNFSATIKVAGPNSPASGVLKIVSGFLQAPGVVVGGGGGGGTGYASSILLSSVSATDISVQGTGNSETATLVFQAQDSLGQNVDQTHGSMMRFSISAPNLGATLTIDSVQTDASGRATTLLRSGIIAGVIQVKAQTTIPSGRTISSLPVRLSINSGLPDQNHFTIGAARLNFPGLRFNGLTDVITIQMGDAYGNPVQTGTTAYFTTNHGIIQTAGSTTNSDGFISKTLFSANPRPEPPFAIAAGNGFSYVTVSTNGSAGNVVHDSVKILWTGLPIITRTSGFAGFSIPKGGTLGPWTFTVVDLYGHPMSAGTSVTAFAAAGLITGNMGTLPDTQTGGAGITTYTIFLTNTQKVGGTEPSTASDLVVTVNHPVYGSFSVTLDSGTMQ